MSGAARLGVIVLAGAVGVVAVGLLSRTDVETPTTSANNVDTAQGTTSNSTETIEPPGAVYDPVHAGEETPSGFRQLLPRDAIFPIYDPQFVFATDSDWHDEALVIGLVIDGDARAYPVSFLNRREIVNDHVGKTPVLVTW